MKTFHVRLGKEGEQVHAAFGGANSRSFQEGVKTVVFSHGFTTPGFESSRMFWKISRELSNAGWQTVMFDYRGSGYSDMPFEDMTLQTEIQDLTMVLQEVRQRIGRDAALYVWGMSLGTSVAVEVLAKDDSNTDGLILWGLSAELYERWSTRWTDQFDEKGYAILPSGFIVRPSVVEGMRGIDTYASVSKISVPIFCVAGGADPGGEARMSVEAQRHASADFIYVEIEEGVHAFKGQPELLREATEQTLGWLRTRSDD